MGTVIARRYVPAPPPVGGNAAGAAYCHQYLFTENCCDRVGELDCLPRAVDYCILMGTVMRDDTSQRSHRLAVTQPVVQPTSSTRSPRTAVSQ